MDKQKVLIFGTGYTELLDSTQHSREVSFGEVLRDTCLLNLYKENHVTWVTSPEAKPLLENNPFIKRVLVLDVINILQLESEEFDRIINLDKVPGICALSAKVTARRARHGFTFNSQTGEAMALDKAEEVLAVSYDSTIKRNNSKHFQEHLFKIVGEKWNGEEYVLGYNPKSEVKYDVALNLKVGSKWPIKQWPKVHWNSLEKLLVEEGLDITRQDDSLVEEKTKGNIHNYIDWINSSKMIVTNDSLGLHLGLALKKKVIGLFGPTNHKEIYFYGRGKAILPEPLPECFSCYGSQCERGDNCMEEISVQKVYEEIKNLI